MRIQVSSNTTPDNQSCRARDSNSEPPPSGINPSARIPARLHDRRARTVNVNRRTADVRGGIRGEKTCHICKLLRRSKPTHRQPLRFRLLHQKILEWLSRSDTAVAAGPLVTNY